MSIKFTKPEDAPIKVVITMTDAVVNIWDSARHPNDNEIREQLKSHGWKLWAVDGFYRVSGFTSAARDILYSELRSEYGCTEEHGVAIGLNNTSSTKSGWTVIPNPIATIYGSTPDTTTGSTSPKASNSL